MENGKQPINPCVIEHNVKEEFTGLTKREYFAGLAMQGLIETFNGEHTNELVKRSIQAADELLKQLEK